MPQINEQQFLEFYDTHVTKVYRYVYFRVGSEEVAQDLASEAFTRAWQCAKGGKDIGNISAMVYQICRNLIADYFRYISDKLPISLDSVADNDIDVDTNDIAGDAEMSLNLDMVKSGLRLLKEEHQELIIWYYIDDFEVSEIAQIMGKSEGAIRTSLSRAIKTLRQVLEKGV